MLTFRARPLSGSYSRPKTTLPSVLFEVGSRFLTTRLSLQLVLEFIPPKTTRHILSYTQQTLTF
jgi:hypothetical protein